MSNVTKILGAAGGVAAIGFGVYYPLARMADAPVTLAARPEPAAIVREEPKPMTAEEQIQALLPALEKKEAGTKKEAIEAIALTLKENAEETLSEEGREKAARALIDVYSEATEETPEAAELRRASLRVMMTQLGGDTARHFAVDVMGSGPDAMKAEAARFLLEPGAIRGGEVTAKGLELARGEAVPAAIKPALLRRLLGQKAEPELLALLEAENGPQALKACAVEIQNLGKPELMGKVLSRLEQAGVLKDAKAMPWFSGRLLSEHIRSAEGEDLARALRVVWLRPSLTRKTMKAVEEKIAHADPQVRRMVAKIVPDAVKNEGIDADSGEQLLAARLGVETDPAVKGEIEGSLAQVRQTRRPQEVQPQTVTQ